MCDIGRVAVINFHTMLSLLASSSSFVCRNVRLMHLKNGVATEWQRLYAM